MVKLCMYLHVSANGVSVEKIMTRLFCEERLLLDWTEHGY